MNSAELAAPSILRAGIAIGLFVCPLVGPPAAAGQAETETATIRYDVRPERRDAIVELRVTATFRGERDGATLFSLPSDRFGVAHMHRWVRDLEVSNANLVAVETGVFEASHEPNAVVEVAYTLSYDADGTVAFGPSVGPDHFHFFGSQWMARVGAEDGARDVEVVFHPAGWMNAFGSSFGIGAGPHRVQATDYDLDYSVIAGGAYRSRLSECRERPVLTMVRGDFQVPDREIFPLVGDIVCGQRQVMDDYDRPLFTVFVTEREGIEAGAPLLNGFTALLDPDISRDELRGLLAHEMIHTWLPRTVRLVDPARPDAPEAVSRWFHEGFTEYLARLVLVRQELAPHAWMVERVNEDLERLAYHPYRTLTLAEIEQAGRENRYNNHHHRLHYLRGSLIALNWDARIRSASDGERSLLTAIRNVIEVGKAATGTITTDEFYRIMEDAGVDARSDIHRYLEAGEPIAPAPDAFGPSYMLGTRSVPTFEPGFDVRALIETREITGLEPSGPAARAGLREGMPVAGMRNGAPWRGAWDPGRPTVVLVERDGDPLRFEFRTVGAPMEVPVYRFSRDEREAEERPR